VPVAMNHWCGSSELIHDNRQLYDSPGGTFEQNRGCEASVNEPDSKKLLKRVHAADAAIF
jgi:hypothetical protein